MVRETRIIHTMEIHFATTPASVTTFLTETLAAALAAHQRVLWLVPGGSAATVAVAVAEQLRTARVPLATLTVSLTDERYGPLGHPDENWSALLAAGFDLPGATMHRVLQAELDRDSTAASFESFLRHASEDADMSLGFFGIGADGHTSGIKPHAFAMDTPDYVAAYQGEDFDRITTTPAAIASLDIVVAYATGAEKRPTLQRLAHKTVAIADQPAQCLSRASRALLFTDQQI